MDLVDNHRANCTQCGKCLDVCPMYDDIDLLERLYGYLEGNSEIDSASLLSCLTCGLCGEACPEGLGIKMLISPARQKWVGEHGLTDRQTLMDPDSENNLVKKVAEMSEVPEFRDGNGSVVYFPGCASGYINTNMAKAAVALLEKAGVDYTVISGVEYCCGAVSAGAGNPGPIQRQGPKNIEEVRKRGGKILVTTCPGCFKAFKEMYPRMFGDPGFEVLQISQYLERLVREGKLKPENVLENRVFYHDPCHLTRGMGVHREARELLECIPGTELANKTPENSACCGFGGGVRLNYPSKSFDVASDRYRTAEKMGCNVIITNCAGCMQNLVEAGKDENIKVFDLAEYLALTFGIEIERNDKEMLEAVNRAYRLCVSGYDENESPE